MSPVIRLVSMSSDSDTAVGEAAKPAFTVEVDTLLTLGTAKARHVSLAIEASAIEMTD